MSPRPAPPPLARALGLAALLAASPAFAPLLAQGTGRLTGTVTDSASGRALGQVQVQVAGTRLGTLTDENGRFTFLNVPAGAQTVEGRRLGYVPVTRRVTITAGAAAEVTLAMRTAALTLQAVVTTGVVDPTSGTRVPFTVGRVDAANAPVPAANAVETIQGKVAGVTVIPSGQPGSGTNVVLRSPTSINKSNSPLVVVDGVILSQSFDASSADLEALDIESVEIVKGAAAASLYGSRASAGVIQIRTRRGADQATGTTRVTARSEFGSNSLAREIDWAKYHYFRQTASGGWANAAGRDTTRVGRVPEAAHLRFQDNAYPTETFDQVDRFFDPGNFYKNSVNISQNGGRTNWFMSLVNNREDGVVLNSGAYQQNDLRLNLDHNARENLKLSFSGYHSRSNRANLYGDTFFDLINQSPDVDLRVPDPDGTPYIFQPDNADAREENPLYVLATENRRRRRARTQGSLETRWSPLGWLSADANVSYDRSDRRNSFFLDQGLKTEGFSTPGIGGPGEVELVTGITSALNAGGSVNFLQRFGELTLRSTARALLERESNDVSEARGTNLVVPGVSSLDNATQRFLESSVEEIRTNSYILSLAGEYGGRFIVDGLVRRDGSSLFGPEERWNTYYRASASWRMGEESWWPFKGVITEFKPRLSRGTAGGRPDFEDQFETLGFVTGGGLVKQTLGNRFLRPELATETEAGLDLIVKDRYSLQLSYARNRVRDQLVQVPLFAGLGYETQWQNAGTVEGNTLEATLEAQVLRGRNLTWRMGLVADRSRNRITEFGRQCFQRNEIQYLCAGEPLQAMYGFRFIKGQGELPADASARASEFAVNDEGLLVWVGPGNQYTEGETKQLWGTTTTIGTANYQWGMPITLKDGAGNARVVRIGDGTPDFHVGWSNNVQWRGFSFYGLLDAVVGGDAYNQTNQRMYQWGRSGDVDQVGKPQELKKVFDYYVNLYSAADPTDYFVEDASFVKLRELSVRYQFGSRALGPLSRLGASGVSVGLIGRNLLTWTKYKGYDPEVAGDADAPLVRIDAFDYPRYRTITGNVQITF
ncbi:SusC/RagA family TonB-linked outer membrane protein [Roseisolibacter sp. H3M3-2]|uniref:SusC/RagA family TonB-linked outer membrane protein n=1 Tax=Roseisolibacter sp. H3M3-2 TaxID=3031323 RepID=UPI0023D987AE|nr:SusC/RagA family TonB-linked outer membrane protein [Roseisolibacter sp. H3M3-2]MDF1502358.1 SusC/RagA family TonB-linked outer membrane protein [Roseisolibacter sp. H3M3-2]